MPTTGTILKEARDDEEADPFLWFFVLPWPAFIIITHLRVHFIGALSTKRPFPLAGPSIAEGQERDIKLTLANIKLL